MTIAEEFISHYITFIATNLNKNKLGAIVVGAMVRLEQIRGWDTCFDSFNRLVFSPYGRT